MKIACFVAKLSTDPDDNEFYVNITINDKHTFTYNQVFNSREDANTVADELVNEFDGIAIKTNGKDRYSAWR